MLEVVVVEDILSCLGCGRWCSLSGAFALPEVELVADDIFERLDVVSVKRRKGRRQSREEKCFIGFRGLRTDMCAIRLLSFSDCRHTAVPTSASL